MSVSGKNTQELKGLLENYVEPFSISTDFLNQAIKVTKIEVNENELTVIDITKNSFLVVAKKYTDRNGFSNHKDKGNFSMLTLAEYEEGVVKRLNGKDVTHFDVVKEDDKIIVSFYQADGYGAAFINSTNFLGSFEYSIEEYSRTYKPETGYSYEI